MNIWQLCQATTLDEGLTGNALLQAIHLEKMKEFAGEGILYFDLKRFTFWKPFPVSEMGEQ